jgi:hypothetical protein
MITKKALKQADQELARMSLREMLESDANPRVGTILRHVSASGMSRDISLYYKEQHITYKVAEAMGEKCKNSHGFNAIRVQGCGMDMGFHLVYGLSSVLFGHDNRGGYKISQFWL